jgi:phage shock protein PspC (stress-responsive transcriptional regulator)
MSDHETDQPREDPGAEPPPEQGTPPGEETPPEQKTPPEDATPHEPAASAAPRRLLRSREDRVIGGVAGGLGRYFNVDPVFFRVGFVVSAFLGGLGILLYLAALLFVPSEDPGGGEPPRRGRALTIAGAIVLAILGAAILFDGGWWFGGFLFGPIGFLLLLGAAVWWLVWGRSGEGREDGRGTLARLAIVALVLVGSAALFVASVWTSAAGGGVAVAILVIAIGGLLAVAAFRGGLRWLIVPALAIAAGLGVVAAADIDLDGGYGERHYAPASLAEVRPAYDLGAGSLEVDLRRVDFTEAVHEIDLEVGFGEAVLVVPRDVCVVADADVGAGYLKMLGWDDGGFNVGWDEGAGARADSRLLVDAHVGMGALQVVHDPREADRKDGDWERWDHEDDDAALGRSAACTA